ncbi:MAG: SUMF1/EgtB/PvdO family nonheme iron enzyme [Rhodospirillales bacterium]|nr:SUMF1/EgtB/PvdO family nonheme iron enzyme [Rhodospirillales bacterium]
MSEFELGIKQARAKQRRIYAVGFSALLAAVAALGIAFALAGGTPIEVSPNDAKPSANVTVERGAAVAVGNVIYSLADTFDIVIDANGFQKLVRTIEPHEKGKPVAVTLTELPGSIVATTNPESEASRWFLNGELQSVGPRLETEVSAGNHQVALDNPYFEKVEKQVEVGRGTMTNIEIFIEPVLGRLSIETEPTGGEVTVDGRPVGISPVDEEIVGGRYTIVVEKDGYTPIETLIDITNTDREITRKFNLRPLQATLTVTVSPSGGELLLGGRKITPGNELSVDANTEHTITYLKRGFLGAKRSVSLEPGEERTLSIKLERELGDVEIWSSPKAEVYVDGKKVGTSPGKFPLPAIPITVEIRKDGYRSVTKKIQPSSRRAISIRAQLVPELAARLKESPNEYTNSAGIQLKLFKPSSFQMGAPRHQLGQRANEFQKNVELKKAFYAAKHEVTNSQYRLFKKNRTGPANEPVSSIRWIEAAAYCNWLSVKEGLSPFYLFSSSGKALFNSKADGYRLLSEAEWEWLARSAGKREQTVFPWGDKSVVPKNAGNIADEAANGLTDYYVPNYTDGYAEAAPVGSFPPEPSGLFDITGNVSEFVHDYYSLQPPEPGETFVDPLGPRTGDTHVVKGSSWRSGTRTLLRAAYRDGLSNMRDDVGFRIGRYLYGAE